MAFCEHGMTRPHKSNPFKFASGTSGWVAIDALRTGSRSHQRRPSTKLLAFDGNGAERMETHSFRYYLCDVVCAQSGSIIQILANKGCARVCVCTVDGFSAFRAPKIAAEPFGIVHVCGARGSCHVGTDHKNFPFPYILFDKCEPKSATDLPHSCDKL